MQIQLSRKFHVCIIHPKMQNMACIGYVSSGEKYEARFLGKRKGWGRREGKVRYFESCPRMTTQLLYASLFFIIIIIIQVLLKRQKFTKCFTSGREA